MLSINSAIRTGLEHNFVFALEGGGDFLIEQITQLFHVLGINALVIGILSQKKNNAVHHVAFVFAGIDPLPDPTQFRPAFGAGLPRNPEKGISCAACANAVKKKPAATAMIILAIAFINSPFCPVLMDQKSI